MHEKSKSSLIYHEIMSIFNRIFLVICKLKFVVLIGVHFSELQECNNLDPVSQTKIILCQLLMDNL